MPRAPSQPKISGRRSATEPTSAMVTHDEIPTYGSAARWVISGSRFIGSPCCQPADVGEFSIPRPSHDVRVNPVRRTARRARDEAGLECSCTARVAAAFSACLSRSPAMSAIHVRPFHRRDRDQLTDLVNARAAAVVPGQSLSVAAMLSHLEREPGEFIVDPWVTDRASLVAEQNNRIPAAAHLLRYGDGEDVGVAYRGGGEIRWLLFWPEGPVRGNPWWTAGTQAASELIAACIAQFDQWHVTSQSAGGELPVPGVYGVPEQWPHVSALYEQAGFVHDGHTEQFDRWNVTSQSAGGELPVPGVYGVPEQWPHVSALYEQAGFVHDGHTE